jgi:hypothetical protein
MPQDAQSETYPPDRIAFFSPPDKKRSPGGAISKTDGDTRITKAPKGHAMLYLMVDDLEQFVKVSLSSSLYPSNRTYQLERKLADLVSSPFL